MDTVMDVSNSIAPQPPVNVTNGGALYIVFVDRRPWRYDTSPPRPSNPDWRVAVVEVVGESEKRIYAKPISGGAYHLSRDGRGREFVARDKFFGLREAGDAFYTRDLDAALAYREWAGREWAAACAARDDVVRPYFDEIARLGSLIRETDVTRDQAAQRIHDAAVAALRQPTASDPAPVAAESLATTP